MGKKRSASSSRSTRKKKSSASDDGDLLFGSSAGSTADASGESGLSIVPLREAAEQRYLNYALSVITSRALPDVRDGLKPVHRRILYTMWQQRLVNEAKPRKSATVCGAVMGNLHPHGDQAIYDALVRMAQPWMMRVPLIEGVGNFGSLDGDPPAAYRYTECRLQAIAAELLDDIGRDTVDFRPNYDGTKEEPIVLPAKLPNLLLNGTTGIAVGMATNIPPHNLDELCKALLRLIDNPDLTAGQLAITVKGPDFPTGGQIVTPAAELRKIYTDGSGAVKIRGTHEVGKAGRGYLPVYLTSIPYNVNKAQLVEQIGGIINARKMPLMLDVKDVSADDVRIEVQVKKDASEADIKKVMAYLYKHTPLQSNFNVNLTFLVPTENPEVAKPVDRDEANLKTILWYFLRFRLDVVTRRLENELRGLEKRIHLLNGFAIAFDVLDEIIRIIRKSEGKADAAVKIMAKFGVEKLGEGKGLDAEQTDAILELKLYRLARLEIQVILDELKEKQKRAREIRKLLKESDAKGRWAIVRGEIEEIQKTFGKAKGFGKRLTQIIDTEDEPEFTAEDFIVAEDAHVLISADGWVKRQKEIKDPANTRMRAGDKVLACEAGSTRATMVFFSNLGTAYTCRIADLPATTGFGEPVQKLFKFKDGEKVIAAFSLDPRSIGEIVEPDEQHYPPTHAIAATSDGYALRFSLQPFVEPSTKSGRKFARPAKGAQVIGVNKLYGDETLLCITQQARSLLCTAEEVNYLSGPGKGVMLMKLDKTDQLLGMKASTGERDLLRVITNRGAEHTVSTAKYETTSRAGKGHKIVKTGTIREIVPDEPVAPVLLDDGD